MAYRCRHPPLAKAVEQADPIPAEPGLTAGPELTAEPVPYSRGQLPVQVADSTLGRRYCRHRRYGLAAEGTVDSTTALSHHCQHRPCDLAGLGHYSEHPTERRSAEEGPLLAAVPTDPVL